jgi:membrane fusion protein, multidrug efflux system
MSADVRFYEESISGNKPSDIVAPTEAVGKSAEGNFVFVLHKATGDHYLVEKRPVLIGKMLPNGFEIINGLEENEIVVTAGLTFLRDGMKVKLLEIK